MKKINIVSLIALIAIALAQISGCAPSSGPGSADAGAPSAGLPPGGVGLPPEIAPPIRPPVVVPPAPPDTRTPAQIRVAACQGANGDWRCPGLARPRVFAASSQPIIPTSWTVPAWFIDPANSSTTASDANDCVTSATACLTYGEIAVHRWGTYSPRIQQATTMTVLSSQAANTDPFYLTPRLEGFPFTLQGNLGAGQTIATGSLSNVTAKNRATPQLLQAQSGATAVNQLVVNTTVGKASRAFTYKVVAGSIFSMTQPIVPQTVPSALFAPFTEVDTWANTDTVTVYAPPTIFLGQYAPVIEQIASTFSSYAFLYQLTIAKPGNGASIDMNSAVSIVDSVVLTGIAQTGVNAILGCAFVDSVFTNLVGGPSHTITNTTLAGGNWQSGNVGFFTLASDTIVATTGTSGLWSSTFIDTVYLESGHTLNLNGLGFANGATPIMWGPGTLNVRGRLQYTAGAGGAATSFPTSTLTLALNNQTKGCTAIPSAASAFGTCNLTVSATTLDAQFGATSGCLSSGGNSAICNY